MNDDPAMIARIAARHAEIVGTEPRFATPDRASVAGEVQATTANLIQSIFGSAGDLSSMPIEAIPEIMFTLQPFRDLWQSLMDVTVQLQGPNAALDPRDRKLAILRTGWVCQAPYEFGEHVQQAHRMGITSEEVDAIVEGPSAACWNDHERAILQAVDELHDNAMVGDACWDRLAQRLDEAQLFELVVLIGQFTATAYFQNSLRLRLEASNAGLAAR